MLCWQVFPSFVNGVNKYAFPLFVNVIKMFCRDFTKKALLKKKTHNTFFLKPWDLYLEQYNVSDFREDTLFNITF